MREIKGLHTSQRTFQSTAGFTILEQIIVVTIIGIMGAIATPSWTRFVQRQNLNAAQNQIYRSLQDAKSNATLQKITWQFSIRERNNIVQWAVHPDTINPDNANWHDLDKTIRLDPETTLEQSNGVRRIQFDYKGNIRKPPLGRVTLSSQRDGKTKRCVVISTFIGTIRTAQEHPKVNADKKYCY